MTSRSDDDGAKGASSLLVHVEDRSFTIDEGSTFSFGRDEGPGQIGADDSTVSRIHGVVGNHADRWDVASVGSYMGFLVHDVDSAATIEVPAGVGPIGVPFQKALLVVPARRRHSLVVESPHSVTSSSEASIGGERHSGRATEQVVPESACFDRQGRPLRWFQVLTALCEPRLMVGRGPVTMPSDNEIRQRLGMGSSAFDRAFARAREELGFEPYTHLVRVAMVNTALHQGIVRPEHLGLLDAGRH